MRLCGVGGAWKTADCWPSQWLTRRCLLLDEHDDAGESAPNRRLSEPLTHGHTSLYTRNTATTVVRHSRPVASSRPRFASIGAQFVGV